MADLTTVAVVKSYGGISGTTYDSKLATLLTMASRMVENYADRQFISSTYTEYLSGRGSGFLSLSAYPITVGPRVRIAVPAIEIRNTSTSNTRATVALSVTAPTLALVHAAGATSTTTNLAIATYTTVTSLVDAVDAVGSGWDATVVGDYGSEASGDLRPTQSTADALNDTAVVELWDDYAGYQRANIDTGTLWGYFPEGLQNIRVDYTGGYSTIPDPVVTATCEITLALHRMGVRDTTLKSETLGDYKYENFANAGMTMSGAKLESLSPIAALALAPYKRPQAL